MKTKIQRCEKCGEETVQDIGKKQGTNKSGAYVKRRTSRCRQCGTIIIENRKAGRKVIPGKNQFANSLNSESEDKA